MKIRLRLVALFIASFVLFDASPAFAHAQLESTDPANNAVLVQSPNQVTAHFGEPVEISLGSLRVYDSHSIRVDSGKPEHPGGDTHSVAVKVNHLAAGGYVVTWRVISADSHPVHGAWTFSVGSGATTNPSLAQQLLAQGHSSTSIGIVYGVIRSVVLWSLAITIGAIIFVFFVFDEAWTRTWFRRFTYVAICTSTISTAMAFLIQGVYAAALPFTRIFEWTLISGIASTRFGLLCIVRDRKSVV